MRQVMLFAALATVFGMVEIGDVTAAAERARRSPANGELEIVLQYDFFSVDGTQVTDGSGKKHHGRLQGGQIVEGKRRPALKLDGKGLVSLPEMLDSLSPASRPLTVGALCKPTAGDGVVAAMGDKTNGLSLYLKGGVPQFAVRASGELFEVSADDPVTLGQWVHLIGAIDAKGELWLIVNGWPTAHAKGRLIPAKPNDPFCVGSDTGSPVGEYAGSPHWQGLLEDVRLYWGFMDRNENRDLLGDWADLPGCGCRK